MKGKDLLQLILSLIICQLAGFVGSLFTTPSLPVWYASLNKPSFNPPNGVFAPVWTTLFFLMGLSLYFLWRKRATGASANAAGAKFALIFFCAQLALNVFWSILFFGLHAPLAAFVEIIFLWAAILITILRSLKVSRLAAYLLLPYILWVSFAAVLNFFLWKLNS